MTILPTNISVLETDQTLLESDLVLSATQSDGLPDTQYYHLRQTLDYTDHGKIREMKDNTEFTTAFIWGYDYTLPFIKAENVDFNTLKSATELAVLSATLGSHQDINLFLLEIGDLSSTSQKNKWETFNAELRSNPSLLRSAITTFTYNSILGISSQTDVNGKISYFEYDGLGRLDALKDYEENLIKAVDYQYKVQQ